jgi:hypothetical protein
VNQLLHEKQAKKEEAAALIEQQEALQDAQNRAIQQEKLTEERLSAFDQTLRMKKSPFSSCESCNRIVTI